MNQTNNDMALLQVLMIGFEHVRLPLALQLKTKVDHGQLLNDIDIAELELILTDLRHVKPLLDRHTEWQMLAGRMASLYHTITTQALENEQHRA